MPKNVTFNADRRLLTTLETLITEDNVRQAVAVAVEALSATKTKRSTDTRLRGDPIQYEDEPDWSARLVAVHFLAEGKYGKPKQRVEMNHGADETTRESAAKAGLRSLLSDPAAAKRMLDALIMASGNYIDLEVAKPKQLAQNQANPS